MTKTETLSIRVDMDTKEKAETISAMQEARLLAKDPDAKTYADADALFADILYHPASLFSPMELFWKIPIYSDYEYVRCKM